MLCPEWKQWQQTGTLKRDETADESDEEEKHTPLQPSINQSPSKIPSSGPNSGFGPFREIATIPEEEGTPLPPSSSRKQM